MELRQLNHFLTICDTGSFTEAAEALYLSQQGLSMSIKRLETELGCPLFIRTHKGIALTKDGEYLYKQAKRIMDISDKCTDHFQKLYHNNEVIHIAISTEILSQLPFELQKILRNKDSDFHIQLHAASGRTCETFLDQGDCSIGFICGPIDHSKYRSRLLMVQEYSYIVNENHPYAEKSYLQITDFKNQPLIFPGKDSKIHMEFSSLCRQHGFKAMFDIDAPMQTYIYNVIRQDDNHIGQLLDSYAQPLNDPHIRLLKLADCDLMWRLYLVSRNNHTFTEKERQLLKIIYSYF